jgi:hypothetical protein
MRLVMLCEGFTEKEILKAFLQLYCTGFTQVEIVLPAGVGGAGRLKTEFKAIAERELYADADTCVICLIDLLKAPFHFPRQVEDSDTPRQARFAYIRQYMEEQIEASLRGRFRAIPVVMELETWLLGEFEAVKGYLRTSELQPWPSPEDIPEPARHLNSLFRRFRGSEYDKRLHGRLLFNRADARKLYDDHCPHFEPLINELLSLQGIAPLKSPPGFAAPNAELFARLAALQQQYDALFVEAETSGLDDFSPEQYMLLQEIDRQIAEIDSQILRLYRG